MTLTSVKEYIITSLSPLYDAQEAQAIAHTLVSHVLRDAVQQSFDNIASATLKPNEIGRVETAVKRLLTGEPLQYILEEAWFYNLPFYVNQHVLIPRPETEELVEMIMNSVFMGKKDHVSILDIGTGSGCIPITLKKHIPDANIVAVDVSQGALDVARLNARNHKTDIHFINCDILNPGQIDLPGLDLIVSNPPYITNREQPEMHQNVLHFEPHLALFVEDDKPLLFYEAITAFAVKHLDEAGQLFFEINAHFGKDVELCMTQAGFRNVHITKDMQGKDRFVSGVLYR